jgi:hypothetical protein
MARIQVEFGEKDTQSRGRIGFVTLLDSNRPDDFQITRSPASLFSNTHLLHPQICCIGSGQPFLQS